LITSFRISEQLTSSAFDDNNLMGRAYWERHFGARGYFCPMADQMTEEMINNHLEHDFERNPSDEFEIVPNWEASFR
jgi:putative transposase